MRTPEWIAACLFVASVTACSGGRQGGAFTTSVDPGHGSLQSEVPRTCPNARWHIVRREGRESEDTLTDVWGAGPDAVFAVASSGQVLRFDGRGWTSVRPTEASLNGVWGLGPKEIYAVGDYGGVLKWDGSQWSSLRGQEPYDDDGAEPPMEPIRGVGGPPGGPVYFLGDGTLVLRPEGFAWAGEGWPDAARAIWGPSPQDLVVVTIYGVISRFNGSSWTEYTVEPRERLEDVWGSSPHDVFAVGAQGLIVHYDGTSWTRMESGTNVNLGSVWGSGPADVFAVGLYSTILHFDGTSWRPLRVAGTTDYYAVWGIGPCDVYVVGSRGTILHLAG